MDIPVHESRARSPRAQGRRVAIIVYYALAGVVGAASAVQITRQVYFEPSPASPYGTCREGLGALFGAVSRAREAAAGAEGGEDAALARFRSALDPEWSYRDAVAAQCRPSAKDAGTLDAIERLRYAEEHAVRREAGELAPLRRKVQAIVNDERVTPAASPTSTPAPGPTPRHAPERGPLDPH